MKSRSHFHASSGFVWSMSAVLAVLIILVVAGCGGGGGGSQVPCTETIRVAQNKTTADIIIYSATPSGIAATIQAVRQGKSVILLEPTAHIGGMNASGIGVADVVSSAPLGGLVDEYFATVNSTYGKNTPRTLNGRAYEPHVAELAFRRMLPTCNVRVVTSAELVQLEKTGTEIVSITTSDTKTYSGKVFIDASYEGDLMAAAGIDYAIGREASTQYLETNNGVGKTERMYGQAVDPYVIPGKPASGLIRHVQSKQLPPTGQADKSVMAYNYRLCITQNPDNRIPFSAPANYDPSEFEALARLSELLVKNRADHHPPFNYYLTTVPIPNGKFDLNTGGYVSTDYVGMSESYPDASPAQRRLIDAEHTRYQQGILYFLQTSDRIPDYIRAETAKYGLCKDEFTDNGGWPHRLYLREGRRMVGTYVITQHDVDGKTVISDPIGLGAFYYDSHTYNRVAQAGVVISERNDNGFVSPYPISYGALTPKASQATNLLVSVCMSASHTAFTSMRVEPTYMIMGQAAGAAAAIAADQGVTIQKVPYDMLAQQLRQTGQILRATP
jgi:hypothetical protein